MKLVLSQRISNLILIASLSLVGFWGLNYIVKHQKDEGNLITLMLGVPGLIISAWQALVGLENARNKKQDEMFAEVEETLRRMQKASERQDLRHDQQILELPTKQSFLEQKVDLHAELFGHPESTKRLFDVTDKINSLSANVAFSTQYAQDKYQLERVKSEIASLRKKIEALST